MADRLIIVRHGATEWSVSGQHTSRTDLPLLPEGRAQAEAVVPKLAEFAFSLVLTSPLRRARETCEIAGFAGDAEVCDELTEWGYGDYEGLTSPQIWEQRPDWNLWRDGCPGEGGESPAQVSARADAVLERIAGVSGDVLTFAHGHILRVLTVRWLTLDVTAGAHFKLETASLGVLGHERSTPVVERWSA